MKRFYLIIILFCLIVFPIKSVDMSIGFYMQHGKTVVDAWNVFPDHVEIVAEQDKNVGGYFIQVLIKLKKVDIGVEVGRSQIYNLLGFYPSYSIYWGDYLVGTIRDYKPLRVLGIIQGKIKNSFFYQAGIGFYNDGPYPNMIGPYLGLMTSARYHFKLWKFLTIPVYIRSDFNSSVGTPISFSIGTGLVFGWKSGL